MINGTFSEYKANYPMLGRRYPTWTGFLTTHFNQVIPIKWTNVAVFGNSAVEWAATDMNGKSQSLVGTIDPKGVAQLKLIHPSGTFTLTGSLIGPGRINGNWSVEGNTIGYGNFDIVMANQKTYTIYRIAGGVPQTDHFSLALDPVKNKYVNGVGIDSVGHYLILGKIKSNGKLDIEITYKSKFTMRLVGKKDVQTNHFKGEWSISGGGKGEFTMLEDDKRQDGHNMMQQAQLPLRNLVHTPFGVAYLAGPSHANPALHMGQAQPPQGFVPQFSPMAYTTPLPGQAPPQMEVINMQPGQPGSKEFAKTFGSDDITRHY